MPQDLPYRGIVALAKGAVRALDQRIVVRGAEHLPRSGPVLIACNHISYADFIYAGYAALPRLVRFMAKREIFDHPVSGPVMRSMRHISVDRAQGDSSVRTAMDYLKRGEAVGIFPEATISRAMELKEFKTGAMRIAASLKVPVVPMVVWGTQRLVTKDHPRDLTRHRPLSVDVGAPLWPTTGDAEETAELKAVMGGLLDHAIRVYPDGRPAGAWWLPASYGGGAPTLAQATELDAQERAQRVARARERAAAKAAKH